MTPFKYGLAAALICSSTANAQPQPPALEEILVTAQKRVESLSNVALSISAFDGDKLEQDGINSLERVADYIPNFTIAQTGMGPTISIRGISSGVNQGFEQSAAQFVDGVHFGRTPLARAPLLDIERIEVLRGPQSILLGKNSTAGAISVITAQPTQTFSARATALYEPEYGKKDTRFIVSGPISQSLAGRLAILDSRSDGFYQNSTLDRDESEEKERVIRGTINWKPSDNWNLGLKLEKSSFDSEGRHIEVVQPIELSTPGAIAYSDVLALITGGSYLADTDHDFKRQSNGDYSYNDTENLTLSIETELGRHSLTATTGYTSYEYEELCDCDFIGVPIFNILSEEKYQQWSQEVRIASPATDAISYIGGIFFQTSELEFADQTLVPADSLLGPTVNMALQGASSNRDFEQDNDIAALFAQVTWAISEKLGLTLGGRYTTEEKSASRRQYHVDPNNNVVPLGTPADTYNLLFGLFNIEPYPVIADERNESSFTPLARLQYQFDTGMAYASFTTGFKSGGFDVRANGRPDASVNYAYNGSSGAAQPITGTFEFEDEKVKSYEIGGKFTLADGAAELNLALFRSEFTDMQTSQFDGGVSFNVTNAAEAVVQGVELDGRWALADNLLLRGGAAYLDFEYEKFANAQCYFGQVDNILPAGDNLCDISGQRREFTPEYQGNLGLDHTRSLAHLELNSSVDFIYSGTYLTSPSLHPEMKQSAYIKVNARLALSNADKSWEIALIGKNLTDESIMTYANGLPVASILTSGTGSGFYAFYEAPRTIALQASLWF